MHIVKDHRIFETGLVKTISKIFASVQPPKQQLGRWTVEYCDRMTRKLDWANHDHCGPCNIQIQTQTRVNNGIYVSNNTGKIHININSEK